MNIIRRNKESKATTANTGFCCKCGYTNKHKDIVNPTYGSGRTNKLSFNSLLQINITLLIFVQFLGACNTNSRTKLNFIGSIQYNYQGCFASGHSNLTLYQNENDIIVAKLLEGESFVSSNRLTPAQVDTFYQFINELKRRKFNAGCTTVGYYTAKTNNETIQKTDGSCDWNGFDKLIQSLFRHNN